MLVEPTPYKMSSDIPKTNKAFIRKLLFRTSFSEYKPVNVHKRYEGPN